MKKMDGKKRWNNITFVIEAGSIICIAVMLLNLLCFHMYNIIDSDMSSELVLANQLAHGCVGGGVYLITGIILRNYGWLIRS